MEKRSANEDGSDEVLVIFWLFRVIQKSTFGALMADVPIKNVYDGHDDCNDRSDEFSNLDLAP